MRRFFTILLIFITAISSQSQDFGSLYTEAIEELRSQNYKNALDKLLQLDSLINYDISVDTTYAINIIEPILYSCDQVGDYETAIKYATICADIVKNVYGKNHPVYTVSLSILAGYYSKFGNYLEAIKIETEAMENRKKLLGPEHMDYAASLSNLAFFYSELGNYSEAIRLETEALEIYKKVLGVEHPNYALTLNNLAINYCELGNYFEAIRLETEALEIRKKVLGVNHPDYATSLSNLASCYSESGNYSEAIRLGTEAMEIRKRILGPEHPHYAASLNNIASSYSELGNYSEAIRLGTEAMEIHKKVLGSNHPDYATSLNNLANYYSYLGDYSEAIRLGTEAMEIRKKVLGTDHPDYATSLYNLANDYKNLGNYSEAVRLGTEAMEIRKKELGPDHPYYASSLSNLANYYVYLGNYSEAIRLGTEAMEIRKKVLGADHPNYAISVSNLAGCYSMLGNYSEAIRLATEAMEIHKKVLGSKHPHYLMSLSNMAEFYFNMGLYNEAMTFTVEYLSLVRENIFNTFSELTVKERQVYWNKYSSDFSLYLPNNISQSNTTNGASTLYDYTALFAKGLLLSTELEMTKLIQESGDNEALQMYSELRKNRQILNVQYSKPIAERYLNCDSLEKVSNDLERKLVTHVKEFGDYTRNLSITWQDVQSKLNDNDIAIEFISYRDKNGEIHYAALTLCKNDTTPILTPLFVEAKLLEVSKDDETYQTEAVDSLIWGPILSMLEGKSNVFFSASGMLHNIGIEYLHSMDGKECYRLSSTRELVTHKPDETLRSATLYGDIDYDATYGLIESSIPNSAKNYAMNETDIYRGTIDYRSISNGVSYLPGTRVELNEVSALMKQLGVPCETMTGIQASEESFKALSGQHKSLLHISTHGFYYNDEEANSFKPHIRHILEGNDRPSYAEDRSMLRCGLCFAGANQTLLGKSLPAEGQGDGILNALEIAQTDLRGLDLVVLSACQTALGDVTQGEGVFGLQRGFKKAGAKSILMSLWNVDDFTTQLLMVEFYRNYLAGKSKQESLRNAQQYVRDYKDESGNKLFDDPHYWAGFILLDALD